MAEPERKPDEVEASINERWNTGELQRKAVAVDPPPAGAVGIQELLNRFEGFVEAGELQDPPENGVVGVRELLARLANLAEAGYFAAPESDDPESD